MAKYWVMTAAQAELFFERCIEREAVTMAERLDIMDEMEREFNLDGGELDEETSGGLSAELKRRGGVIGFNLDDKGN